MFWDESYHYFIYPDKFFTALKFGKNLKAHFKYFQSRNVSQSCGCESPPVFSSAFALSCSDVFTINVRLLSVNTSIDTAQRFTAYASFWLSHLLDRRKRTEMHVSGITFTWLQQHRLTWRCSDYRNYFTCHLKQKNLQRLSGHKQSLLSSQQVVTKINLDLANRHKESPKIAMATVSNTFLF